MSKNEKAFGLSLVGGFRRKDVLEYIEQTAKEHAGLLKELRDENARLQSALEREKDEKSSLESRIGESEKASQEEAENIRELGQQNVRQKDRLELLEASAETQKNRILELETMLKETKAKAGELELENFELMASLQKYESYITDVEDGKKLVFEIELEARKRAEGIETEALKNAEMARCVLSTLIRDAQSRFDYVRTDVESTASHVVSELEKIISTFLSINMSFDDMAAKLAKLNVYIEKQEQEGKPDDKADNEEQGGGQHDGGCADAGEKDGCEGECDSGSVTDGQASY